MTIEDDPVFGHGIVDRLWDAGFDDEWIADPAATSDWIRCRVVVEADGGGASRAPVADLLQVIMRQS